jgi:hypothetical protein
MKIGALWLFPAPIDHCWLKKVEAQRRSSGMAFPLDNGTKGRSPSNWSKSLRDRHIQERIDPSRLFCDPYEDIRFTSGDRPNNDTREGRDKEMPRAEPR